MDGRRTDIELTMAKTIDHIAKLLEITVEDVYRMPIPLVQSMIAGRIANLKESRYKAEKTGEVDIFSKEDFYGMRALVTVVNSMFGGKSGGKDDKPKGAQNITQLRNRPGG